MMMMMMVIVILLLISLSCYGIDDTLICNDFFTIMSSRMPWKDTPIDTDDTCSNSFIQLKTRLNAINNQMLLMNSTLTVYTTYNMIDCDIQSYTSIHKSIKFISIDTLSLLKEYNFQSSLARMNHWNITGYTRTSDILRILLQHKYRQTYIDVDIHFIDLKKEIYYVPFTSVCIWQEYEHSLEITNSAFCLSNEILLDMIKYTQARITLGTDKFHYAELGPGMFRQIILNHNHHVHLYSQNHPKNSNITSIVESIKKYNHKFLHFTTSIRKEHRYNYQHILSKLQSIGNLQTLSNDYDYSYKDNLVPILHGKGKKVTDTKAKSRIKRSKSSDNDKPYVFEANIYNKSDDDVHSNDNKNEKTIMLEALKAIVKEEESERFGMKLEKKADAKTKAAHATRTQRYNEKQTLYEKKLQRSNHKKRHQDFFGQLTVNDFGKETIQK